MSGWLNELRVILRFIFRRKRVEDELEEEFRYHLERAIDEGLRRGLPRQEAEFAAMRAMGAISKNKEESRDSNSYKSIYTGFAEAGNTRR